MSDTVRPRDVSPDWNGSTRAERRILKNIMGHQGTGKAVKIFAQHCDQLGDYWYWFTLSTLWVHYSGHSDLNLWRELLRSDRANRRTSLMKPSECLAYIQLPRFVRAFRAHRPNECDWISYTLDPGIAAKFALQRGVETITEYMVPRDAILALFLRRAEQEVIVLERFYATEVGKVNIVDAGMIKEAEAEVVKDVSGEAPAAPECSA